MVEELVNIFVFPQICKKHKNQHQCTFLLQKQHKNASIRQNSNFDLSCPNFVTKTQQNSAQTKNDYSCANGTKDNVLANEVPHIPKLCTVVLIVQTSICAGFYIQPILHVSSPKLSTACEKKQHQHASHASHFLHICLSLFFWLNCFVLFPEQNFVCFVFYIFDRLDLILCFSEDIWFDQAQHRPVYKVITWVISILRTSS